jgi:nucleoside-diphosphate kinase
VLQGVDVVAGARKLMGATNPQNAEAGTIRSDYAQISERNVVHGSDSLENATREINLYFNPEELSTAWNRDAGKWITDPDSNNLIKN